jgi:hypothetical protein
MSVDFINNPLQTKNLSITKKTTRDSEEKEESEESSEINLQCINFLDTFCEKLKYLFECIFWCIILGILLGIIGMIIYCLYLYINFIIDVSSNDIEYKCKYLETEKFNKKIYNTNLSYASFEITKNTENKNGILTMLEVERNYSFIYMDNNTYNYNTDSFIGNESLFLETYPKYNQEITIDLIQNQKSDIKTGYCKSRYKPKTSFCDKYLFNITSEEPLDHLFTNKEKIEVVYNFHYKETVIFCIYNAIMLPLGYYLLYKISRYLDSKYKINFFEKMNKKINNYITQFHKYKTNELSRCEIEKSDSIKFISLLINIVLLIIIIWFINNMYFENYCLYILDNRLYYIKLIFYHLNKLVIIYYAAKIIIEFAKISFIINNYKKMMELSNKKNKIHTSDYRV